MKRLKLLRAEIANAYRWRLQGELAQAMVRRVLASSASIALLILAALPFSETSRPGLAASFVLVMMLAAWYGHKRCARGEFVTALQVYSAVQMLLVILPVLIFSRNPAYCGLILFALVPTIVAVLGAGVALAYVAVYLLAVLCFIAAIWSGFNPPVLFPLIMPIQMITVIWAGVSIVIPLMAVLRGVVNERARGDRELADRQCAERALKELTESLSQRLSQSELVLSSALDVIGEAFVVFDPQDRLVYCNEEYRRIYKLAAAKIEVGRTFEEILRCGADNGLFPDALGQVNEWVAERVAAHQRGDTQLVQQLASGQWMKVMEKKTPSGHIVSFRVDISEQLKALETAEAANRAKNEFLATMSHEIRTPMNAVLGMAQVLLNPELEYRERMHGAQTILRSGQAMMEVLNDILDVSKIESGKFELRPQRFQPVELVQECMQLFVPLAMKRGLKLEYSNAVRRGSEYFADSGRIRQILSNLVGNAVKFTERGSILIEVCEVDREDDEALLEYSVTDTGAGIEAEHLPSMFQPFTQMDSSNTRKYGGTGLGLSIVSRVAELMGGAAGAESEPGIGSRFWFRIRAGVLDSGRAPSDVDVDLDAIAGEPMPTKQLQLRGHILLVEDQPIHRKLLALHLDKLGVTHEAVENGAEAVARVLSGRTFNVILMDMNLPELDGVAATKAIRKWELSQQRPPVPIVAVTANAYAVDRSNCLAAGMNDFLAKPVYFDTLAVLLRNWLPQAPLAGPGTARELQPDEVVAFKEAAAQLLLKLQKHAFGALSELVNIKTGVAGSAVSPALEMIHAQLKKMEFEAAEASLRQLIETM